MAETRLTLNSETCPYCGANLLDSEIPLKDRHLFGGQTHFKRQIAIERLGDDYISSVKCPDCGAEDSREFAGRPRG